MHAKFGLHFGLHLFRFVSLCFSQTEQVACQSAMKSPTATARPPGPPGGGGQSINFGGQLLMKKKKQNVMKECKGLMCPFRRHPSGLFKHHCCGRCFLATHGGGPPGHGWQCLLKMSTQAKIRQSAAVAVFSLNDAEKYASFFGNGLVALTGVKHDTTMAKVSAEVEEGTMFVMATLKQGTDLEGDWHWWEVAELLLPVMTWQKINVRSPHACLCVSSPHACLCVSLCLSGSESLSPHNSDFTTCMSLCVTVSVWFRVVNALCFRVRVHEFLSVRVRVPWVSSVLCLLDCFIFTCRYVEML